MQYSFIFLLIFFVGFYYISSRAQKKQKQEREKLKQQLVKGAEVETIGGLIATIDEVDEANRRIVLDADGVYLTFDLDRCILKVVTPAGADKEQGDQAVTDQTSPELEAPVELEED